MRRTLPLALAAFPLALVLACGDKDTDDTAPPEGDTDTDTDTDTDVDLARWTIMIFMNGDNDLESWVFLDLNELERADAGEDINIVVQADRAEGYSTNGGDWTNTRRYLIEHDTNDDEVVSELLEDMGELDMGSPDTLSEFLLWADEAYPAERVAVVIWNHGEGWMFTDTPALPGTSWDDSSGNDMSIAEGELQEGLQPLVDARGPIDVLAFDACNMGAWEVAHAFQHQALTMVASESTVGMNGYAYDLTFTSLGSNPAWTERELAADFARQAVEEGGEWTQSAIDLAQIGPLSTAIDELAQAVLDDDSLMDPLLSCRSAAQGTDHTYNDWYMDIGSLSGELQGSGNPGLSGPGASIEEALDAAVIANFTGGPYRFASGLNILFDERWMQHLRAYQDGAGATWSQDTHWDELLFAVSEN